jgi:hypothetical protein
MVGKAANHAFLTGHGAYTLLDLGELLGNTILPPPPGPSIYKLVRTGI